MATAQENQFEEITQPDDAEGQFLTFLLAGEEYGVEILKVQEIKGWDAATAIPNTPEHILGVLNLRGAVVPIVDLRMRFELESIPYSDTTVIIVVKIDDKGQERTVGLVVDAVADVYRFESSEIQPPPDMGTAIHANFVHGLASVNEKMIILLKVDRLLDFESAGSAGEAVNEVNTIDLSPNPGDKNANQ